MTIETGTDWDHASIKAQFPILNTTMQGEPLVYLDSGASTQKPSRVIDALKSFYEQDYTNVHRGVYELSQRATAKQDEARRIIQQFINADSYKEVIFTRNATEGFNLVAQSFVKPRLSAGDEVLISEMEHHANIVPWQMVAREKGAAVVAAPVTDQGELDWQGFLDRISERTRFISLAWISNVMGTINPVEDIIRIASKNNIPVMLDAAQAVQHKKTDVQALDADFIAFSGHKIYGPSGVGVLWGKAEHLETMPPYQGGGDMIEEVTLQSFTCNELPFKFEAGTPDIAGIHALGVAIQWLQDLDLDRVERHETALLDYAMRSLKQVPGLNLLGDPVHRSSALAFNITGAHHQDIGTMLDLEGIAVRTGHHCAMPLHERFGKTGSARASIGLYNDEQDIDHLCRGLHKISGMFS